jgi:hypothetical protein
MTIKKVVASFLLMFMVMGTVVSCGCIWSSSNESGGANDKDAQKYLLTEAEMNSINDSGWELKASYKSSQGGGVEGDYAGPDTVHMKIVYYTNESVYVQKETNIRPMVENKSTVHLLIIGEGADFGYLDIKNVGLVLYYQYFTDHWEIDLQINLDKNKGISGTQMDNYGLNIWVKQIEKLRTMTHPDYICYSNA